MPDFEKVDQCVLLAKALWFLPPPARAQVAAGMYDLGVRVHPELATKQLLATGPPGMGAHRPQQLVNANANDGMAIVREFAPELADRMDAATTEAQKQQILADIRERHSTIIAQAEQQLAAQAEKASRE